MFLPTKAYLNNLKDYEAEPTLRIGRKVPKNAVNLAYYFNPKAADGEKILCADAPRNTIDHRVEEKYLYKYNCPDKDNSEYKYFDQFYFYEDEEGYAGYLPLVNVTWYEKNHVLQKSASLTKTYITSTKNDMDTAIFYMENEDGDVVEGADPSSDTNGVYSGNLFLDTASYEIKSTNTEIVDRTQYINILNTELVPQNLGIGYTYNIVSNANIDHLMKNPLLDSSSPWPSQLWVLANGIYNNPYGNGTPLISGNPYNGYVSHINNPLLFSYVEKDPLSWNEVGGEVGDTEYQEEYGRLFLSRVVRGAQALTTENQFPPAGKTYSTQAELEEFYTLMTNSNYTEDDLHDLTSGPGDGNLNDSQTMFVRIMERFHNGLESANDITVECLDNKDFYSPDPPAGVTVTDQNKVEGYIASFRMIYIHRANNASGTQPWSVYANYTGQLQKTMQEIRITPATWEATCIYSGIVRKTWNTYDGMAYYKGSVTQGEGAGNINPELSPDILLFPDDDGWLRRQITSSENDDEGNLVSVTKNVYEIEAEHFYITDVFKNNIACFYKYDLKFPINDYRGPDKYGFYSGDAVKVYTANMKPLPDGYEYQLKLDPVDTETETFIVDNSIQTKEVAIKYNATLYTSFISKTTDAYKASYNAFVDYDTDTIINTNNGIDEEIFNIPFMHRNIHFFVESINKYERTSKIQIINPKIIEDTRAWIDFEYKVVAYKKTNVDGVTKEEKFESSNRKTRILNKEYAVESEYIRFEDRGMIISPKKNNSYLTPLDIILEDEAFLSTTPVVTANNSDEFLFYCELVTDNLNNLYYGAINIKCNADGSGYITAETTLDTGFFNEQLGTYTDKLIINNPYLIENNKIYAGYMVKCLDVRQIGVHPPREDNLLDSWYPLIKYGHYTQVMDQYGAHTKICYSMPEYDEQDYSPVYGIPYIDIKKEKAEILNTHMVRVNKYPLLVLNSNSYGEDFYKIDDNKAYKLFKKVVTWKEALAYCESIGGTLGMAKTKEINDLFIKMVSDGKLMRVWLGGTDEETEGIWKWVDGTAMTFTDWVTGQPDDYQINEDYLELNMGGYYNKWNDLPNIKSDEISGFICEFNNINTIKVYRKKDDELFELTVKDVSFSEGIIITEEAISENDYILVDYTYLEEYYQYRGYLRNEVDFTRIDLNPNQYHTYSDMNYEPSEFMPTTNLYNKTIYFYLKPTIRYRGKEVVDKTTEIDSTDSSLLLDLWNDSNIVQFNSDGTQGAADKEANWTYDINLASIVAITNVSCMFAFLTKETYGMYEHSVTLNSSSLDNDTIVIVISAVQRADGTYATLSLVVTLNITESHNNVIADKTEQFSIIYNYYQSLYNDTTVTATSQKILISDSTFNPGNVSWSNSGGVRVKICKTTNNYIQVYRTPLGNPSDDNMLSSPVINISLSDIENTTGVDFTEGHVGYGNASQDGVYFSNIKLETIDESMTTHIEWNDIMLFNEHTLYHTIDKYWPESELDIYIGSVYIRQNTSLYSTILIDTRTRGGGILEEMKDALRRELEPESDFYLDIGCYDGRPYQENAVIIVRLDNSILEDFGGRFKQGDVENKVKKFLGLGVYPIIEYVDSYSKHELPQYNLDIQDEYTNMLDQTLDFSLECVSV